MKAKEIFVFCFILILFTGCKHDIKDAAIQAVPLTYKGKIDSLYLLERVDDIRIFAHKELQTSSFKNLVDKAYLFSAIGNSYRNSFYYDSAVYYCEKGYQTAKQANNIQIEAITAADLLNTYLLSSKLNKKQDSLFKALEILEDKPMHPLVKGSLIDAIAWYHNKRNERELCLFNITKAVPIYEQFIASNSLTAIDSIQIGLFFIHLGYANRKMKSEEKGNEYLEEGRRWITRDKYNLAYYYYCMTDWDEYFVKDITAPIVYKDSLCELEKHSGYNFNDLAIESIISVSDYFFYEKQDYKTAWKYAAEAHQFEKGIVDPLQVQYLTWLEADLYLKENNFQKSLKNLYAIQKQAINWPACERMQIAKSFAECYAGLGNTDSATKYYKEFIPISTETYLQRENKIEKEAEAKYLNKINKAKITQQQLVIQYARKQRIWLITSLTLALLGLTLLYILYKKKQKIAQKLNDQNEQLFHLNSLLNESNETKSKLFGIISHDLRSPISQLYQLLKIQRNENHITISKEEKIELEKETDKATEAILENMDDLLIWSKTQMQSFKANKTKVDLSSIYLRCEELLQLQIQHKQLLLTADFPKQAIIESDTNFLLTIIRNLLQNAIKASPPNETIVITYEPHPQHEDIHYLQITNKGNPFTQQDYLKAIHNNKGNHLALEGLGLQIVDELSRKINIDITFESIKGIGSCCRLTFYDNVNVKILPNTFNYGKTS